MHSYQPEYTWAKYIALKSKQDKDYLAAEKYFNEALDLVEIEQQKADIYLNLADLAAAKGQKASARSHAYKAMEIDPSKKEGYAIIGRLYMNSFHDCAKKENMVQDRSVYFAAYEMFKKAGDQASMRKAQEQFPQMSDIFTYNYQLGDPITVDCWINETVTIQKNSN